jgi:hypothetical protein
LVIGLQSASIVKGLPTYKDLEDLFADLVDDKAKAKATFHLVVDTSIITKIDIHRDMFVFDWFLANIVEPNFAWANFTRAMYGTDKQARAVDKATKMTTSDPNMTTAPSSSRIDCQAAINTNYARKDLYHETSPVVAVTV